MTAIDHFGSVLESHARADDIPGEGDIYGWLIGSWRADVVDFAEDGTEHRSRGEWHFARVLEGRAVQDVWIVPPRAQRTAGMARERNRYGTTLRIYDATNGVWRVTWLNPVTGVETRLIGRRAGDDIVHDGADSDGTRIRWSFREIQGDSFVWIGERSADGGETWRREAEFRARRMDAEPPRLLRERDVLWRSVSDEGFEHLSLSFEESRIVADGVIVRRAQSGTYRSRYIIESDLQWRVRRVTVERLDNPRPRLVLSTGGDGHWVDASNNPLPALDGCTDIDIRASPFTNTLAIERLRLDRDESRVITVVFIDPADLTSRRVSQRYTRVDTESTGRAFRYESLDSGFTADLSVDADGLLLEYPDYFRRVW